MIAIICLSDPGSRKSVCAGAVSWCLAGNLETLLERLWEGFELSLTGEISWGHRCFFYEGQDLVTSISLPIFFIGDREKVMLCFPFLSPHTSVPTRIYFISGLFFFLGIFLLIIIPFPPVTMPRLREVIFNHLFHQCLFLASFTNWGIVMPLPNPQSPLFLSFPLSLYHWIPSHCL